MIAVVCVYGCVVGHGSILLTRPRPLGNGSYDICFPCARRVRQEQDDRSVGVSTVAENGVVA
jgi:hypothetical protein